MRFVLKLTVAFLFITNSITSQTMVPLAVAQENEQMLLIKKGRELAHQTGMKELVPSDPPSRPDVIELETASPGTLLFLAEQVKMDEAKSEYVALIVIVGKGKETEEIQLRYYYKYTVTFEKRNNQWEAVGGRYTHPPKLI